MRRRTTTSLLATTIALVVVAAGLTGCRAAPQLQVTTFLSGTGRVWDVAFTPGGSMLFTEKGGPIRIRTTSGAVRTLADPADVVTISEGGMMGLAVDPNYDQNRRIYTCQLSDAGGSLDVRIVRWRVNNASTGLGDRRDIVTGLPVNGSGEAGRHSGCRPRFGPDGNLWVGTGDAAIGSVPQSPTSLGGKVLRIDRDGRGVPGNMTAPFDSRIYSYGHRNVQGIAFSPGGKAYSIEHGTSRDDEVNRLVARANYGWDPRPLGGGSGYDESRPMTDATRHPGARAAVWRSGTRTIAPSGGTFLRGERWGGWDRTLAMAVLKDQQLRVLAFDQDGAAVTQEWIELTGRGRMRVAVAGPDGSLYVAMDQDPGSVLRVTPTA